MSHLGSEAGDIVVAFTSVPFGAFLLSTKTKLLVFVPSFGTGPGKRGSTDYCTITLTDKPYGLSEKILGTTVAGLFSALRSLYKPPRQTHLVMK